MQHGWIWFFAGILYNICRPVLRLINGVWGYGDANEWASSWKLEWKRWLVLYFFQDKSDRFRRSESNVSSSSQLETSYLTDDDDDGHEPKDLSVAVSNPEKHTTLMETYVSFKITTKVRYNPSWWIRFGTICGDTVFTWCWHLSGLVARHVVSWTDVVQGLFEHTSDISRVSS